MLSCCCNHFGVKAMGLMRRGGMGIPPPGPLPLVPPPNLLLKQLTNLYALFFVCLFVFLHVQDYFKLFEVAKECQLNCEL